MDRGARVPPSHRRRPAVKARDLTAALADVDPDADVDLEVILDDTSWSISLEAILATRHHITLTGYR